MVLCFQVTVVLLWTCSVHQTANSTSDMRCELHTHFCNSLDDQHASSTTDEGGGISPRLLSRKDLGLLILLAFGF